MLCGLKCVWTNRSGRLGFCMCSYYHGLKALAHPRQAQKGFSRGSFEAYQHVLTAPAKQGTETLPWLLHGLDELEEHRRHSMSASVSEAAPYDIDQAGGGRLTVTTSARNQVHFSVCIEQWRITQKIIGFQSMCAVCLFVAHAVHCFRPAFLSMLVTLTFTCGCCCLSFWSQAVQSCTTAVSAEAAEDRPCGASRGKKRRQAGCGRRRAADPGCCRRRHCRSS